MVHKSARQGWFTVSNTQQRLAHDLLQSGLTAACLSSPHSTEHVSKEVLAYIKKWIPERRVGVLAGNSVHADRGFLSEEMPDVVDWLHYRCVAFPRNDFHFNDS